MNLSCTQGWFWLLSLTLGYAYIGYPVLIMLLARVLGKPLRKQPHEPSITVVMICHNEEKNLRRKIDNLLALDYPRERLEILIASDGSTDGTATILHAYSHQITVFPFAERKGKSAVLNEVVPQARGDIIVFTDARQTLGKNALRHLAANFADNTVGVVSGDYFLVDPDGKVIEGFGLYWQIEKFLRMQEAALWASVGATGALYAIRKQNYRPIPEDALLDDVSIPLKINAQGLRTVFEPDANVFDRILITPGLEWKRKVRTMAGNFQIALAPWKYGNAFQPRLLLQYLSHKFIRLWIPLILAALLALNVLLAANLLYGTLLAVQACCYTLALAGLVGERKQTAWAKRSLFKIPSTFLLLNAAVVAGFVNYLKGNSKSTWVKTEIPA